jgi:hypothetical protein
MKNYIFYTNEGYTQDDNKRDIENCQIIGWAKGDTPTEAFKNLKQEYRHLKEMSFNEVICQRLACKKRFYFSLAS